MVRSEAASKLSEGGHEHVPQRQHPGQQVWDHPPGKPEERNQEEGRLQEPAAEQGEPILRARDEDREEHGEGHHRQILS